MNCTVPRLPEVDGNCWLKVMEACALTSIGMEAVSSTAPLSSLTVAANFRGSELELARATPVHAEPVLSKATT